MLFDELLTKKTTTVSLDMDEFDIDVLNCKAKTSLLVDRQCV